VGLIALDTNVLIRYMVPDDPLQFRLASDLIQRQRSYGQPALVTLLVILESEWVLRSAYRYSKSQIMSTFVSILKVRDVIVEDEDVLERALALWKLSQVNFANCLILARSSALGCSSMVTFDKTAAKKLPSCVLLKR